MTALIVTVTVNGILVVLAFVFGFVLGGCLGSSCAGWYHSKKECRECRRRMVEHGFHSGGVEYVAERRRA